jgi:hypothetical protein
VNEDEVENDHEENFGKLLPPTVCYKSNVIMGLKTCFHIEGVAVFEVEV